MINNLGSAKEMHLFRECLNVNCSIPKCLFKENNFAIVGSGLSFAAANFLSLFLNENLIFNRVYTPLEYCRFKSNAIPILLTYKGKNHDIISVVKHIINSDIKQTIVITGHEICPIENQLKECNVEVYKIVLPHHNFEHRFVSFRATVSMIAVSYSLSKYITSENEYFPDDSTLIEISRRSVLNASHIAKKIVESKNWSDKKWIALGRGVLDPFSVLIQSVFAEAGILSIQIADYKDYAHGKYLSAFQENNNAYILLNYSDLKEIYTIFNNRFSVNFDTYSLNVSCEDFISCFESVITIFYLAAFITESKDFDFRNPPKPKEMKRWTSWGKIK